MELLGRELGGEPSGAGPDYSGLSRRAFGLWAYAVACAMRVSQQTVTRCLERAAELGVLAALDDRARIGTGCEDYGGSQNLACWVGSREADAIWLSTRAVDHPTAGRACARSRTARRPSKPGKPGKPGLGNGVQDPRRA
jgi:hypothetical protein